MSAFRPCGFLLWISGDQYSGVPISVEVVIVSSNNLEIPKSPIFIELFLIKIFLNYKCLNINTFLKFKFKIDFYFGFISL